MHESAVEKNKKKLSHKCDNFLCQLYELFRAYLSKSVKLPYIHVLLRSRLILGAAYLTGTLKIIYANLPKIHSFFFHEGKVTFSGSTIWTAEVWLSLLIVKRVIPELLFESLFFE